MESELNGSGIASLASIESERTVTIAHHVATAFTFVSRLTGLLGRRELPLDHGLLLHPGGSVHTLGMRFPIDVLFLDRQGRILKIAHSLRPNRAVIAPRGTHAVLELAAGRARVFDLDTDHVLRLAPGCAS